MSRVPSHAQSQPPSIMVGEFYKVRLPGESPWAECKAVHPDGSWEGRIDNELVGSMTEAERAVVSAEMFPGQATPLPSLHNFKFNDVVRFSWQNLVDDYYGWLPAEQPGGRA